MTIPALCMLLYLVIIITHALTRAKLTPHRYENFAMFIPRETATHVFKQEFTIFDERPFNSPGTNEMNRSYIIEHQKANLLLSLKALVNIESIKCLNSGPPREEIVLSIRVVLPSGERPIMEYVSKNQFTRP